MDLNLKELQEMNNAMKALEADIAELQEFNENLPTWSHEKLYWSNSNMKSGWIITRMLKNFRMEIWRFSIGIRFSTLYLMQILKRGCS